MEKKERRMEEEAQGGEKAKERTFWEWVWGRDCCFMQPMAAKVHKEISLCFWGPKGRNSS